MVRKSTIAYTIFFCILCYLISPWFFERNFFINELLSLTGITMLIYKKWRIGKDAISISFLLLLSWCLAHAIVSLYRMDTFYYYLRNLVIVYSMMTFFIGYYLLHYLGGFIISIRKTLRVYIIGLLIFPVSNYLYERFTTTTIFPALFRHSRFILFPALLIILNIINAFTYESSTAILLAGFYMLVFISPGYRFFKQVMTLAILAFILVFIYLMPNLSLVSVNYSPYTEVGIYNVINSHPLLAIDGNSTWRLVLWKQIIVDNFPGNILGYGFGTPMLRFFPIEDYAKKDSLPYILGAHNSYVYLFGRLGIIYIFLILAIYSSVFKEYFNYKNYYKANNQRLIFLSFFAITVIAVFNPTLETPIYAGGYWFFLGLTARSIHERQYQTTKTQNEDLIYT